jgi:hypothetical protein
MGADCKSVGLRLRRFESCTCHTPVRPPFEGPDCVSGPRVVTGRHKVLETLRAYARGDLAERTDLLSQLLPGRYFYCPTCVDQVPHRDEGRKRPEHDMSQPRVPNSRSRAVTCSGVPTMKPVPVTLGGTAAIASSSVAMNLG